MAFASRFFTGSARQVALVYALFGVVWVFTSDVLVVALVDDPVRQSQLQTVKGWVFVVLSAFVVYGLVHYGRRNLSETNERLNAALQQSTILHRLLRHNLRNSCNIIQGNADLLAHHLDGERERHVERIYAQTQQLLQLSRKSRTLRDITFDESVLRERIDIVDVIASCVTEFREAYPDVTIQRRHPEDLRITTDPRISDTVHELLENAVEHNDTEQLTVDIAARSSPDGGVRIDIADTGSGIPQMEREVIEKGFETPMLHSQGLGLWLARTLVVQAGGEFQIRDNDLHGTIVTLSLPDLADGR